MSDMTTGETAEALGFDLKDFERDRRQAGDYHALQALDRFLSRQLDIREKTRKALQARAEQRN